MSWYRYAGLLLLFCAGSAAADGYILALGAETDAQDSHALSAFGEIATGESTWLSAGAGASRADGPAGRFAALYVDAQVDHFFDPVGIRVAAAYWGDPDVLDSIDLRSSLYLNTGRSSLSADFERRDYDLAVGAPLFLRARTLQFSADGVGLTGRLKPADRSSVYVGGMWYDYPDTGSLQPGISDLRSLSLTRLVLAHGLLDRKLHAGVEIDFGRKVLDLRYANWRGIADHGNIDSYGLGLLMPLDGSSDIELRLSRDDSDTFGDSTVLSIFLYFFGG